MGSSPGLEDSSVDKRRGAQRAPFERRIAGYSALLIVPGLIVSGVLICLQSWSLLLKLLLLAAELIVCLFLRRSLHEQVVRPVRSLTNVVGAMREEDYSIRSTLASPNDALGELSMEVNALADVLAKHRTGAIEANALVQRVVEEVEFPIFAFDPANRLRLVNSAGEKLLQKTSAQLIGRAGPELGLKNCLSCPNESLVELHVGTTARWFVRRSSFRQQGMPHTLVVLSDVSRALREEERSAWQRLIRVLGHELNNSLAPIKSIASSLRARLQASGIRDEEQPDFERGLNIIENRAGSLNRFLQGYRQLAQMPPPVLQECSISALARRAAALETRVAVNVIAGPEITLRADPDQLEQMVINLLRNAAEAVLQMSTENVDANIGTGLDTAPQIVLSWAMDGFGVVITIEDNGPGLINPSNAFVPFYTTKPTGSGIGLVLSRQVAEAHGGSLELSNRPGQRGCVVRVTLPFLRTLSSQVH